MSQRPSYLSTLNFLASTALFSAGFAGGKAEEVGFEPTEPRSGSTVFKTVPFNHSGTPPKGRAARKRL